MCIVSGLNIIQAGLSTRICGTDRNLKVPMVFMEFGSGHSLLDGEQGYRMSDQTVTSHSIGIDGKYYTLIVTTRNGKIIYTKRQVHVKDVKGNLILENEAEEWFNAGYPRAE